MTGSVIIDGVDIFTAYNAILLRGGDVYLLTMPERKEPDSVSWFEYSGVDVDLEEVYFKERNIVMLFRLSSENASEFIRNLDLFYRKISAKGYREVYIRELDKIFSLRYLSCEDYQQRGTFSKSGTKSAIISVSFSLDDPLQLFNEEITTPVSSRSHLAYVEINNTDLSHYGIIVQNIYNTALSLPAQKEVLTQSSSTANGLIADDAAETTYESYDIVLSCKMLAATLTEFYTNYSALFYQLSKPGELLIRLSAANKSVKCYYTKQENITKAHAFRSGVNVSFNLIFKSIDFKFLRYLLGTEARQAILTEDGKLVELG